MQDYAPERGALPTGIDMAHGTAQKVYLGRANTPTAIVARRLALHGSIEPNCYANETLLPPDASDLLEAPAALIGRYEEQVLEQQTDLMCITTLRFDAAMPCHRAWRLGVGFAYGALSCRRNLAVIAVQHVPARALRENKQHIHLIYPSRKLLHGSQFGAFTSLTKPGAKAILAAEWAEYLRVNG